LENEPFLPSVWLRHQARDAYWQHGSVCEDFGAIKAKVLAVGGWADAYKNAVPQLVENLDGAKGIVGPWVHKYPHFAVPEPRIGFLQEALRWWDRWLKEVDTGVEDDPDYRAYLMDGVRPKTWYDVRPGRWIAETNGATSHLPVQTFEFGDRTLGAAAPFEHSVMSPATCGMQGGEYCAIWLGPDMPGDQRADDAVSLCFDGAPAEKDVDIVGAPTVTLTLRCDTPQAQMAVRLNHIHPDGASTRITYGVLNLSQRDSAAAPSPLTPDKTYEVTLSLDHIAYRLPKGHRLRVAVSTAYWPLIWPTPEPATLTLTKGQLALPVRDTAIGNETTFEPPEAETPWQTHTLREGKNSRRVEHDLNTGLIHLIVEDDFGKVEDADHGLISGSTAFERWTIHPDDPLSARGECFWTDEMGRGDLSLRTETSCNMHSDATHFYFTARLEAFEGETLVYARDINDKIERQNL